MAHGNSGVQRRVLGFAAVSAVAGVAALFVLQGVFTAYEDEIRRASEPEETVMVMVAARNLYQGITIEEADLYAVAIAPRYLPENVFLAPEYLVGRTPRERILANEFVRSDRLANPESGVGMNAVIPQGYRAISVDLADGRALAGFLHPTNFVDVILTIDDEGESTTRTILQSVFVLGVNNRMGSESQEQADSRRRKSSPTVTLLVTADEAESVAFAEAMGQITLSLRSSTDRDRSEVLGDGVTLGDLIDKVAPPPPPRVVRSVDPRCGDVVLIRGSDRQELGYDCEGYILP